MEHTYRMRIFHDKLMDTDLYFLVDNEMPTTEEGKREGGLKRRRGEIVISFMLDVFTRRERGH